MKYIPKDKIIWCPFDEEWSAFYRTFLQNGFNVIRSSLAEGQDFFAYEPPKWDVIVSNPPFSIKDKIIKRLYAFEKPFAVLLPLNSLQGITRYKYFSQGIQVLAFDARIRYFNTTTVMNDVPNQNTPFASAYFCRDLLLKDLILEKLNVYDKPLYEKPLT